MSQLANGGAMICAIAVPPRVTPMASPREAEKTPATAAVQTVDLTASETRA